ncbi:MAG: hypothetical protein KF819_38675, partial [Labilithrix sp.]|nr:hypothetical protein [Labilithrix sp.]
GKGRPVRDDTENGSGPGGEGPLEPAPSEPSSLPGSGSAPSEGEPGESEPPPPAGPLCGSATAVCASARPMTAITGDGVGTTTSTTGAGTEWLSIVVREDSFAAEPIGAFFTLTSPAGSQFELSVYDASCMTLLDRGPVAYVAWPDTPVLSDTRTLMLEIKHVGGACDATHRWTLTAEGGF